MNRRVGARCAAGAVATFLVAAWVQHAAAAPKPPAACAPGKAASAGVNAAIDGATLRLDDGRVVTLAGVEAPLPPIGPAGGGAAVANAAGAALARIAGSTVRVALVGDKPDRYGRWRANVFDADGALLAAQEVAAGLARVHRLPGDPVCVLALLDVERGARVAALGMWADSAYRIRSATDQSLIAETGLYQLVAGTVLSIGHGDAMTFVNFGHDYARDFTVMITPAVARNLATAGLDVDGLAGKRVVVRGMIEASGGPAIRLGEATDIEVLDDGG